MVPIFFCYGKYKKHKKKTLNSNTITVFRKQKTNIPLIFFNILNIGPNIFEFIIYYGYGKFVKYVDKPGKLGGLGRVSNRAFGHVLIWACVMIFQTAHFPLCQPIPPSYLLKLTAHLHIVRPR